MSRPISSPTAAPSASLLPGTVARGQLRTDELMFTGRENGVAADKFPFPITRADLERGRERYNVYCTPCHDYTGGGRGMIVQRGFPQPPSYHIQRLRDEPAGHFFEVMTNGYGAMFSYAARVDPADRWRIAAYIRVLQLSQNAKVQDVPEADRQNLTSQSCAATGGIHGAIAMNATETVGQHMDSVQKKALPLGVLGIILAVVFGFMASRSGGDAHGWQQFFQSYILAYIYWFAITMGCMAILMIHHVTGGWWGYPIRRILEAGTRMVPWMAVLFIPVLVGLSQLYPWTWPGVIPVTPFSHFKQVYLTRGFFAGRAIVCFAIWLLYSNLLNTWSKRAG